WVDGGKKAAGFGEKHPTTENAVDGMRSQADRRVEVLMFDDGEEPDLAATNGEDIYDGVTFERTHVEPMKSARPWRAYWEVKIDPATGEELPARMGDVRKMILEAPGLGAGEMVEFEVLRECGGWSTEFEFDPLTSDADRATCAFGDWDLALPSQDVSTKPCKRLPKATFRFHASAGGRTILAGILSYSDTLSIQFTDKDTGKQFGKVSCRVLTSWGILTDQTDELGAYRAEALPPGGARVVLVDYRLLSAHQ
ncbi:MAG: hypothetical protein ACM3ZE_01455, partial [Myxococcales bacterium]